MDLIGKHTYGEKKGKRKYQKFRALEINQVNKNKTIQPSIVSSYEQNQETPISNLRAFQQSKAQGI